MRHMHYEALRYITLLRTKATGVATLHKPFLCDAVHIHAVRQTNLITCNFALQLTRLFITQKKTAV